ncbi:GRAM domain-containing 1A isoform X3 [Brachionus plicatilis]|uniref:GRAM domain-containing 1A isoform X3 n=1 Tax=Brachionus plicatilis TaxID=10195 RepID=A0A3M7RU60_BRAPC|nr:GRAM domain-containing 1A isoform X3 [Brachionus plicatilis]
MNKTELNITDEKDSNPMQIFSNAKEAINNFVKGHSRSNSETYADEKKKKRQWFIKPKEELKIDPKSRSSSVEPNLKEDLIEELSESNLEDKKVECDCTSHEGKELLNNTYDLSVDFIFDCLFNTKSDFNKAYLAANKFLNLKPEEWIDDTRKLEYNVDVGAFGKTNNIENQKILKKIKNECYVIETEVSATGVMYADCLAIITKFCITKLSSKTSKLIVNVKLDYKKKPNLMSRSLIERNTFSNMKSCFEYIDKNLVLCNPGPKNHEQNQISEQENKQNETQFFESDEIIVHDDTIKLYFRLNNAESAIFETLKTSKINFSFLALSKQLVLTKK